MLRLAARMALIACALCGAATSASAVTIGNLTDGETACCFGFPNTQSFGQSIKSPGEALQSFTFHVTDASSGNVIFRLAPITGTTPSAPIYQSAEIPVAAGADTITITGIDTPTTLGAEYLAYLTVYGATTPIPGSLELLGNNFDVYSGGQSLYYAQIKGEDPTGHEFSGFNLHDLEFTAEFGELPEPGTIALLATSLAGLAFARRGRRP